jgi:hypothetical protein
LWEIRAHLVIEIERRSPRTQIADSALGLLLPQVQSGPPLCTEDGYARSDEVTPLLRLRRLETAVQLPTTSLIEVRGQPRVIHAGKSEQRRQIPFVVPAGARVGVPQRNCTTKASHAGCPRRSEGWGRRRPAPVGSRAVGPYGLAPSRLRDGTSWTFGGATASQRKPGVRPRGTRRVRRRLRPAPAGCRSPVRSTSASRQPRRPPRRRVG